MDISLGLVLLILGFIGSFFSGLLGIGGAILNYPMLLFIPAWLDVAHFSAQEVSSITMFQVLFASLAGVLAFRSQRGNNAAVIHKGLVMNMGISIMLGSVIGGTASGYLSNEIINVVYGILAVTAVIFMLIPNKVKENEQNKDLSYSRMIAIVSAFLVGMVSGIVGAGGAFILIPIMLTVLKIPMRVVIASSLAIVFISAIGGVIGKIATVPVPIMPTLFTVLGSMMGAPIGSRISAKINVKYLRYGLVVLISLTAIQIWTSI